MEKSNLYLVSTMWFNKEECEITEIYAFNNIDDAQAFINEDYAKTLNDITASQHPICESFRQDGYASIKAVSDCSMEGEYTRQWQLDVLTKPMSFEDLVYRGILQEVIKVTIRCNALYLTTPYQGFYIDIENSYPDDFDVTKIPGKELVNKVLAGFNSLKEKGEDYDAHFYALLREVDY